LKYLKILPENAVIVAKACKNGQENSCWIIRANRRRGARRSVEDLLIDRKLGNAGARPVIEEYLAESSSRYPKLRALKGFHSATCCIVD
jgi:hypothetical protein